MLIYLWGKGSQLNKIRERTGLNSKKKNRKQSLRKRKPYLRTLNFRLSGHSEPSKDRKTINGKKIPISTWKLFNTYVTATPRNEYSTHTQTNIKVCYQNFEVTLRLSRKRNNSTAKIPVAYCQHKQNNVKLYTKAQSFSKTWTWLN